MLFRRTTWLRKRAMLAIALVALVVLGLGLPRALLVCTQPCCGGHVKLSTACETRQALAADAVGEVAACGCCRAARGEQAPGEGEQNTGRACGGCFHIALGVELGLPPAAADLDVELAGFEPVELQALTQQLLETTRAGHPPSTGPPRCDRRAAIRASIVLRI